MKITVHKKHAQRRVRESKWKLSSQRREQEKIEQSRDKDARNLEVKLALLEIEKSREKALHKEINLNVSSHLQRRENRVSEIVQKQKAHEQKVAEVQKRKMLSPRPEAPDPAEAAVMEPRATPANLDDLPIPTLAKSHRR